VSARSVVTVVPVAPPERAKQRLAPVLSAADRAALARTLLDRTIEVGLGIGRVVVVSRSREVLARARAAGATGVAEDGRTLDDAVAQGQRWAAARAATVMVLPGDLPRVTTRALGDLLAHAEGHDRAVVVAPCQRRDGTNAMLLRPPLVLAPAYGPGSAARHLAAGRAAGAHVVEVADTRFVDLDTPDDLVHFGDDVAQRLSGGQPEA
jgi:2-phospho-L-lactate guanylyltransferase